MISRLTRFRVTEYAVVLGRRRRTRKQEEVLYILQEGLNTPCIPNLRFFQVLKISPELERSGSIRTYKTRFLEREERNHPKFNSRLFGAREAHRDMLPSGYYFWRRASTPPSGEFLVGLELQMRNVCKEENGSGRRRWTYTSSPRDLKTREHRDITPSADHFLERRASTPP
jgi:hypothetical protein